MWLNDRFSRAEGHCARSKFRTSALIAGLAVAGTAAVAGAQTITGFTGPLFGLSLGRDGYLLVADTAKGVSTIKNGAVTKTIPLPGVTDISGDKKGTTLWALTGAIGGAGVGTQNDTGQGLHVIVSGKPQKVANLFAFEAANNPHTAAPPNPADSNPYDVQALGSHAAVVADAGGNDLLHVWRTGKVALAAVFPTTLASTANLKSLAGCPGSNAPFCALPPELPTEPVPTSVALDERGYLYVGELRGFPAPTNQSSVWRVAPDSRGVQCGASPKCVKVFDGGFSSIIDLAFGPDGLLYVVELDEGAWAALEIFGTPKGGTINQCNVKTGYCRTVADKLPITTAIAFDRRGALWATQNALLPNAGVTKIKPQYGKWWKHPAFKPLGGK
jgi:hypothetical protein